jgi:putative FmdB family regulatory protein
MPTYEYRCLKCEKAFERSQNMTDPPLKKCPEPRCGGKVERLISMGTGLIFKGSGFHATDYRRNGKNGKDSEPKPCPAAEGGSCESCPSAKEKK